MMQEKKTHLCVWEKESSLECIQIPEGYGGKLLEGL